MRLQLNPLEHIFFEEVSYELLGLIPFFVSTLDIRKPLVPQLEKSYGFPVTELKWGTVKEGVYTCPEDPDLYPYAAYNLDDGRRIYQYPYGILAIELERDEFFTTRMD